jgi:hypothetical protein
MTYEITIRIMAILFLEKHRSKTGSSGDTLETIYLYNLTEPL